MGPDELSLPPPIREESKLTRITTIVIYIILIIVWSIQANLPIDWLLTLLIFSIILGVDTSYRYKIKAIQDSDFVLYVKPGYSWTLASQSILGGSIVFATIIFLANTSINPSDPPRMMFATLAVVTIFILGPIMLRLSIIHPRWLKTIFVAQLSPPFSMNVERACIFDRTAQRALTDRSVLIPLEEKIRASLKY